MNRKAIAGIGAGLVAAGAAAVGGVNVLSSSGCSTSISPSDGSWESVYTSASTGCSISVKAGSYPAQAITLDQSKGTDQVSFVADPGVNVASLTLGNTSTTAPAGPKHLSFTGFKVTGSIDVRMGSDDITLQDIDGKGLNISSATNVKVIGGDYGDLTNGVVQLHSAVSSAPSDKVSFVGVYLHDMLVNDPANHSECLHVWGSVGSYSVTGSTLQNCTDFGMLDQAFHPAGSQVLWENNFADRPMPGDVATTTCSPGCPRSGNSLRFAGSGSATYAIRYNTLLGGLSNQVPITQVGNLPNVDPAWVVDGTPADGTMDLHLVAGSPAIDAGSLSDYPVSDIDGQLRYFGAAPDLGADEFGGSNPPPTTTTTTTESTTTTTTPSDSLIVSIASQDATTVTLSWTSVSGIGYRFLIDGKVVSHTWDATRSTVKFAKKTGARFEVQAMEEGVSGSVVSP